MALLSSAAIAAPSAAVVDSCLQARPLVGVTATEIPNQEIILQEDSYKPGYAAEYVEFDGKDVGFATAKKGGAMRFDGKLWPTRYATALPGAEFV